MDMPYSSIFRFIYVHFFWHIHLGDSKDRSRWALLQSNLVFRRAWNSCWVNLVAWAELNMFFSLENFYWTVTTDSASSTRFAVGRRQELPSYIQVRSVMMSYDIIDMLCDRTGQKPSLCRNVQDVFLQLYMISFALRKGWRLAAGRLVDRFGVSRISTLQSLEIPNWSSQHGCFLSSVF